MAKSKVVKKNVVKEKDTIEEAIRKGAKYVKSQDSERIRYVLTTLGHDYVNLDGEITPKAKADIPYTKQKFKNVFSQNKTMVTFAEVLDQVSKYVKRRNRTDIALALTCFFEGWVDEDGNITDYGKEESHRPLSLNKEEVKKEVIKELSKLAKEYITFVYGFKWIIRPSDRKR